jgi:NADPH:quinone reductase-like Zn-dependent oxidoreductase
MFKGYATHVITDLQYIAEIPTGLSFIDAASLPVVYMTAWVLVYIMGGGRKGQTLLIQNAGGGVGLAALDIAKHIGMITIGTASKHKHKELLDRGLDHAIDYRNENVSEKVLEITDGKGCDLVIDPIGGTEWQRNYKLLKPTGKVGFFGASLLSDVAELNFFSRIFSLLSFLWSIPKWSPLQLMDENKGVFGVNLGHMWHEKDLIQQLLPLFTSQASKRSGGFVRPRVDAVFCFQDAEKAHEYIEKRKNFGKVMLVPTRAQADAWNTEFKK